MKTQKSKIGENNHNTSKDSKGHLFRFFNRSFSNQNNLSRGEMQNQSNLKNYLYLFETHEMQLFSQERTNNIFSQ